MKKDLKATLNFLFNQCNNKNYSIFKLINSILDNNKIINSSDEEIRKISTSTKRSGFWQLWEADFSSRQWIYGRKYFGKSFSCLVQLH